MKRFTTFFLIAFLGITLLAPISVLAQGATVNPGDGTGSGIGGAVGGGSGTTGSGLGGWAGSGGTTGGAASGGTTGGAASGGTTGGAASGGTTGGATGGGTTAQNTSAANGGASGGLINPLNNIDSLEDFMLAILRGVVRLGSIILVLALVYTGFLFVVAQGNQEKISGARSALMWTVIGGLVLLGAEAIGLVISATVKTL